MALVLMESFDVADLSHFTNQRDWTFTGSGGTRSIQPGRINGYCLRMNGDGFNFPSHRKLFPTQLSTFYYGIAVRAANSLSQATFVVGRPRTSTDAIICNIGFTSGRLQLRSSGGGTVLAEGSTVITSNVWYYVEFKLVIAGASGTFEARLDGTTEIPTTTVNVGSTAADRVEISSGAATAIWEVDDLYVLDETGTTNNTFLSSVAGVPHIETIYATADGTHSAWTPDTGTSHYTQVDEASSTYPDDDTSYVKASAVNARDSYVFANLSSLDSVKAVQTNLYARKTDAGTKEIAASIRRNTTDYDGPTHTLTTGYDFYQRIWETDPVDGSSWSATKVNDAEFGVKIVS